jgi:hypothetical protein
MVFQELADIKLEVAVIWVASPCNKAAFFDENSIRQAWHLKVLFHRFEVKLVSNAEGEVLNMFLLLEHNRSKLVVKMIKVVLVNLADRDNLVIPFQYLGYWFSTHFIRLIIIMKLS